MEIRRPRDEQELAAALALREEVFCGEQGVRLDGDQDGRDAEALQLVAVDGEVLGTCRLLVEPGGTAKFARLCVRQRARGRGLAAALLAAAEEEARAAGAVRIGMHAQTGRSRSTSEPATRPTASASTKKASSTSGWRST